MQELKLIELLQELDYIPDDNSTLNILANTRATGRMGAYTCYKLVRSNILYESLHLLKLNIADFAEALIEFINASYSLNIVIETPKPEPGSDEEQEYYNQCIRLAQKHLEVFYG